MSCEDCQKYERTGWVFKTDDQGQRIPREIPVECAVTGNLGNVPKLNCWGCPNQIRPRTPLSPSDEHFLLLNALCKEFGWTISQASQAPADFVLRWSLWKEVELYRHQKSVSKMKTQSKTKSTSRHYGQT